MSERPYNQGRIPKLKRAKRLALAAEKALREANLDLYADDSKKAAVAAQLEIESCEFWVEENSRPYYGG